MCRFRSCCTFAQSLQIFSFHWYILSSIQLTWTTNVFIILCECASWYWSSLFLSFLSSNIVRAIASILAFLPRYQPVLSNVDKMSCSRAQNLVLAGVEPANSRSGIRRLYHCYTAPETLGTLCRHFAKGDNFYRLSIWTFEIGDYFWGRSKFFPLRAIPKEMGVKNIHVEIIEGVSILLTVVLELRLIKLGKI